jgi:hypothetical protein
MAMRYVFYAETGFLNVILHASHDVHKMKACGADQVCLVCPRD